ncbi:DUF6634 family protein [Rhizobium sp. L43]|uniref:DUF6634 family protein n=1 Tax=Rhizobium sp. L43 TaxID=2035452 RepID=UPI000BE7D55D|nr:DUF6634 family protein [Rhizobium sp. L43]MDX1195781.1 hypothetical protein [Sinorhizobium medicae]PDS76394.1 hypothetical protein CO667_22660 [Rhizobium sp. L43]
MNFEWMDSETVERLLESIHIANTGGPDLAAIAEAPLLEGYRTAVGHAFALTGIVHGHPRIDDGRKIVTSQLFYLDADRGIARTMNRWYRLGGRARSGEH